VRSPEQSQFASGPVIVARVVTRALLIALAAFPTGYRTIFVGVHGDSMGVSDETVGLQTGRFD